MRNSNCKRLAVIRIRLDEKKNEKKVEWHGKSLKSTDSNVGCAGRGCKMKIRTCVPIMPNKKKRTNMTRSVGMWNKVDIGCFIRREIREIGTTSSNKCSHLKRTHTGPSGKCNKRIFCIQTQKNTKKEAKQSEWKTYIFPSNQTNERKWSNPIQHPPKFLCTLPKTGWHTKKGWMKWFHEMWTRWTQYNCCC